MDRTWNPNRVLEEIRRRARGVSSYPEDSWRLAQLTAAVEQFQNLDVALSVGLALPEAWLGTQTDVWPRENPVDAIVSELNSFPTWRQGQVCQTVEHLGVTLHRCQEAL